MTWQTDIDNWATYLAAGGAPDTTVKLRRYYVERLAAADEFDSPVAVDFEALTGWLAGQDWTPNTRKSARQSLRSFWAWLVATGRAESSPAHLLPAVRVPRGQPRPVPEEVYRRALGRADERVRLALRLGGAVGLRRGEIAAARREDVERDLIGWALRVTGKGGHVRVVPLPDDLAADILARPGGWLFPSGGGGPITAHHLAKLMARLLEGYSVHSLRHRCGSVAYHATRDLRAVQELLGHAKPETTALYTLVPDDAVRAAMQAAA